MDNETKKKSITWTLLTIGAVFFMLKVFLQESINNGIAGGKHVPVGLVGVICTATGVYRLWRR